MEEKNKELKEKITMDDLARIVQDGFLKIDERFDGVEQRLDGVEQRLDGVEQRLDGVEQRLDNIQANLNKKVDRIDHNTLDYRVEKLEEKFA
ncbi:MAG: hypothetical protein HGA61_04140 [Candidatus Moranbacteria bacterium]|nr:hypothetical protein [Candidatus Moranbacteria bacterium]